VEGEVEVEEEEEVEVEEEEEEEEEEVPARALRKSEKRRIVWDLIVKWEVRGRGGGGGRRDGEKGRGGNNENICKS